MSKTTQALAKKFDFSNPVLDNLTLESSIELCKGSPEQAGSLLMALIAEKTAALPGTAFVRRGEGVYLKKQKMTVKLTEREGHLLPMTKSVGKGKQKEYFKHWDCTMNGLRKLNELPALQIIRPDYVIVDGKKQMNPYIQVNAESRMPEVVYARCLCVGYSPMGSLVATDAMVRLDVNIYLLENIQAKMKYLEGGAPTLGQYGVQEERPTDEKGVEMPGKWRFLPLHAMGGIGLWVNLANRSMQEILQDHTTRLKFLERLGQSFAERNALKAHPSIPKSVQAQNGVAYVTVTGWTTDFSQSEIDHLRQLVEANRLHEFSDRSGNVIDSIAVVEVEQPTDEDVATLNEEAETQQGAERSESGEGDEDGETTTPTEPEVKQEDLLPMGIGLFTQLIDLKGRAFAKKLLKECGADTLEDATREEMEAFIRKCGENGVKA